MKKQFDTEKVMKKTSDTAIKPGTKKLGKYKKPGRIKMYEEFCEETNEKKKVEEAPVDVCPGCDHAKNECTCPPPVEDAAEGKKEEE